MRILPGVLLRGEMMKFYLWSEFEDGESERLEEIDMPKAYGPQDAVDAELIATALRTDLPEGEDDECDAMIYTTREFCPTRCKILAVEEELEIDLVKLKNVRQAARNAKKDDEVSRAERAELARLKAKYEGM